MNARLASSSSSSLELDSLSESLLLSHAAVMAFFLYPPDSSSELSSTALRAFVCFFLLDDSLNLSMFISWAMRDPMSFSNDILFKSLASSIAVTLGVQEDGVNGHKTINQSQVKNTKKNTSSGHVSTARKFPVDRYTYPEQTSYWKLKWSSRCQQLKTACR
ncbi:hypothetical protein Taro_019564 [Colocasia esculenta]|uniref:Uncharacterized protein n=1 Tax=Colocasia esculenta TaxID=4460 RepID=A0A843UU42_COLES|nr:hypothetical protein [Colocasia esculenta]